MSILVGTQVRFIQGGIATFKALMNVAIMYFGVFIKITLEKKPLATYSCVHAMVTLMARVVSVFESMVV